MTDLVLHLGAHRTGSTGVERTLHANAERLKQEGIVVWSPEFLRGMDTFKPVRCNTVFDAQEKAAFAAQIAATGAGTLVLSEENILGSMGTNIEKGQFYRNATSRLRTCAAFLPTQPKRIGIGIRDYASYWFSVYSFSLGRRPMPPFEALKPGLFTIQRSWRNVIADTRAAFPQAEIIVWPMHILRGHLRQVASLLVDMSARELKPLRRKINASIGTDRVPLAHALREAEPELEFDELLARLDAMEQPEKDSYQPFTKSELRVLDAQYRQELEEFRAGAYGVHLVTRAEVRAA